MRIFKNISALGQSDLARGTLIVLVVRVFNIAASFALSVLLVRFLGLREFGLYASYMAIMALMVLPITSGIPNLIVRVAAPAFDNGELDEIRGLLAFIFKLLGTYLIFLAVAFWLIRLGYSALSPSNLYVLLWLHVLLQILSAIRSALLRAAGHIVRGQLLERAVQPLITLIVISGSIIYFEGELEILHAVGALLFAHLVSSVLGGWWVRQYALGPGEVKVLDKRFLWFEILNLSGSGLLSSVMVNGLVLMISALSSLESTALYRVAASMAQPIIFAHEVLGQVVSPKLAQLWRKGSYQDLQKILRFGVLLSFSTVAIGAALLLAYGENLLHVVYGPDSVAAFLMMAVLAIAHCANACGGFDSEILNMTGHSSVVFKITFVLSVLSLTASTPLIKYHGGLGVCAIFCLYQVSSSVVFTVKTKKITGFDPSILSAFRTAKWR